MSDPEPPAMIVVDPYLPGWGHTLGTNALVAATSCGFDCARKYVHDGQLPEAPPPGPDECCQLAVVVLTGVKEPESRSERSSWTPACGPPVFTAEVRLVVDLCVLLPGQNAIPDLVATDLHALENQQKLWLIMQGLMSWRRDESNVCGAVLSVDGWEEMGQSGGSARWQTRWRWRLG